MTCSGSVFSFKFIYIFFRYFNYIFDYVKKHEAKYEDKVSDSELTELQVQIMSTDPECDGYPSLKTDESCKLLYFLYHNYLYNNCIFCVCVKDLLCYSIQ